MNALIVYWSSTGNTKKVAEAIKECLEEESVNVTIKTPSQAEKEDLFEYDLICFGAPVHSWLPAEPIFNYVKMKRQEAREKGLEKLSSPEIKGKNSIVFCTYAGPHTGHDEAVSTLKWLGQFFEHLGIKVKAEIGVVGENHVNPEANTKGRLGNIWGKPDKEDLLKVKKKVAQVLKEL
jgi:flavorubredoxin